MKKPTPSDLYNVRLFKAVLITNEIHKHAKLTIDSAETLLAEATTSHPVYQTLIGAINRLIETQNRKCKTTSSKPTRPQPHSKKPRRGSSRTRKAA